MPAQPVLMALRELSRLSGVNILFAPDIIGHDNAPAVHGAHSVTDALKIILSGTQLEVVRDTGDGLIIKRKRAPKPAPKPIPLAASSPKPRAAPPRLQPAASWPPAPAISDIIVTALKNGNDLLQQVPAAVTVISADDLERAGAGTLSSLAPLAPGLQVAAVRTTALAFIRGVGTTLTSPNADPAIAVNINGAYVPMEMTASALFDLDRVEVLPGPQGTLYGRNSTGGVINLITKRPGNRLAADGTLELGNYGRVQVQTALDTPLTDTLALRTSINWVRHTGYDSNGGDDQNTKAARLTAVWKPDKRTTITSIGTYAQESGIGPFNFNVPAIYGPYRQVGFDPRALGFFIDYKTYTHSLEIEHQLGATTKLTYVGAYDHLDQVTKTAAWSGTPLGILNAAQGNDTFTQELRLNATLGRFKLTSGLYWLHSDARYTSATDNQDTPVSTTNSIGPLTARSRSWAVFGQGTYALTPKLRITGGLRFSDTDKALTGTNSTTTLDLGTGAQTVTLYPFAGNVTLRHVDWRFAGEVDVLPKSLLYGSVATSFSPGGLSASPAVLGQIAALPFKPVYLTAYTMGLKNRLMGNRVTLNIEGFWYTYRNYQVSQRNLATGQNNVYTADKAQVYGVQIDAKANPTRHDTLSLATSLQRARVLVLNTPAGSFDGFALPFAPHVTLNASWRHTFDLLNGGRLETSVSGEHSSSRWGTYTHAPGTFVPATNGLNASVTYRPPRSHYAIALWGRNLTDAITPTQVSTAPSPPAGPGQEFLAPPRTYGLRLIFGF